MPIDRELSDGSLNELGTIYRELSDGTLQEVAEVYRELADGSLVQVYAAGPAFIGTIRPNADVHNNGGWGDAGGDGGGDLFDEMDESTADDDTTHVNVSTANDTPTDFAFEVALDNPGSDPNGQEVQTLRIRLKNERGDTSSFASWTFRLKEGSTTITSWSPNESYGGWITRSHNLTQAEKDSISDYDNLSVEIVATLEASGDTNDAGSPITVSAQVTQIEMEFS